MHSKRLLALSVVYLLLSTILITQTISAEEDAENKIDAVFDLEMISATDFKTNCELTVHKLKMSGSGKTYSDTQIEAISTSDEGMLGAIRYQLQILINETLSESFEKCKIKALDDLPYYENGKFYADFSINLTTSYLNVNETINLHNFLNGILDMGALLDYSFILKAKLGWNNTYLIDLGDNFEFQKQANGTKKEDAIIEWSLKNGLGEQPSKFAELTIKDKNPTATWTKEDIFLEFQLNATDLKTELQANVLARTIDIQNYSILPDFINNLNYIPADGIRLFEENNLFSWDDLYQNTIKPIEQKIKTSIETDEFNQTLNLVFNWDQETTNISNNYEIENMNDDPYVNAILKDSDINLEIYDISARGLFGLVGSGATSTVKNTDINFGDGLKDVSYPYSISLIMPSGVTLNGDNIFTWNDTIPFEGDLLSVDAPNYSSEETETNVKIEIKNTDLNLLSFFTGNTEIIFGLDLEEERNYNVTKVSDKFDLPDEVSLDYINSDGLRIAIDENIFSGDAIDLFLKNEKTNFEERLKNTFQDLEISGHIDRETFENSLTWDQDIEKMDASSPVKTSSYAYSSYPTTFDLSIVPPGFKIPVQTYYFSGINNQSVNYQMIFPEGVSVDVEDSYDKAEVKETSDGRKYIEVEFLPSEEDLTVEVYCTITPSILFILGVLMPCLIALLIAIIFVVILIILRRKRKKRKAVVIEEESQPVYEEEDYYMPPPPGSK
jgi:hypothetical protein